MKTPVAIPVSKLHPFEGHPYKVLDNEEMNTLIESIQTQGILSPLIVRPKENTTDEYEVVSGHRRLHAANSSCLYLCPRPGCRRHCGGGQQPAPGAYSAVRKSICVQDEI